MAILEILGKIGFDWQVAIANLVNFLIIFFILKRYAFKPIAKIIKERQDKVNEGLDSAKLAETNLMQVEQEKEKIVMQARQDANEVVASAKDQADALFVSKTADATKEHDRLVEEGKKKAQKEFDRMEQEVRAQAAGLIVSSVEKILNEDLDEKQDKKLQEKAVAMMRE